MSKVQNKSHTPAPQNVPTDATPPVELSQTSDTRRQVEWYEQCPNCWANLGGVGKRPTGPRIKPDEDIGVVYFKCDTCGANYNHLFEYATEVTTKKVVRIIRR